MIKRQDFWFPPELEELGGAPTGTRAGQLIFLSGQFPRNQESGEPITASARMRPENTPEPEPKLS